MDRVSVVGCPGSGKTTFAAALAERMGTSHLELDSLYHQKDWEPLPDDEFRSAVTSVGGERWVVDGNYPQVVKRLVWAAADAVIWLDPPRYRAMWSLSGRTLRRVLGRHELWNGNREGVGSLSKREPEENLLLWTWIHHDRYRREYSAAMNDPSYEYLTFIRVTGQRLADHFLEECGSG